jgi:serine/threonine protein kinase
MTTEQTANIPNPAEDGHDSAEHDSVDVFADEIAAYAEARRRGETPPVGEGTTNVGENGRLDDLRECVELLERNFGGLQAHKQSHLPTSIDHFEVQRELGHGGFGVVYLAWDSKLRRRVALKLPNFRSIISDSVRERFLREAQAAAALDHPNIVQIFQTGTYGPTCYIVSAYCDGPNLLEWMNQQGSGVSCKTAAAIVAQLADGVAYTHSRTPIVLHRDLKPSNVMLAPLHEGAANNNRLPFTPRITDFGLAKLMEDGDVSMTSSALGTAAYMPPEQTGGNADKIGPASDVYGLGAILYHLLTGRPPFPGNRDAEHYDRIRNEDPDPPRKLRADVDPDLETICLKCLEKMPDDRYGSARELTDALEQFMQGTLVPPRLPRWRQFCRRLTRLYRRIPIIINTTAVFIVVASFFALSPRTEQRPLPNPAQPGPIDNPGLFGWHNRLIKSPVAVFEPELEGDSWHFDQARQRVQVDSVAEFYLRLGHTPVGKYALRADIIKNSQAGRSGLYFGYQPVEPEDGQRVWRCQAIYVWFPDNGQTVISRDLLKIREDEHGYQLTNRKHFKTAVVDQKTRNIATLEIKVAGNRVYEVRWDSILLPQLSDGTDVGEGKEDEGDDEPHAIKNVIVLENIKYDCQGEYGLCNMFGSAQFADVKIMPTRPANLEALEK